MIIKAYSISGFIWDEWQGHFISVFFVQEHFFCPLRSDVKSESTFTAAQDPSPNTDQLFYTPNHRAALQEAGFEINTGVMFTLFVFMSAWEASSGNTVSSNGLLQLNLKHRVPQVALQGVLNKVVKSAALDQNTPTCKPPPRCKEGVFLFFWNLIFCFNLLACTFLVCEQYETSRFYVAVDASHSNNPADEATCQTEFQTLLATL